jgi:hypothetical protein
MEYAFELPDKFAKKNVLSMGPVGADAITATTGFNGDTLINAVDRPPAAPGRVVIRFGPGDDPNASPEQKEDQRKRALMSSRQEFARLTLGFLLRTLREFLQLFGQLVELLIALLRLGALLHLVLVRELVHLELEEIGEVLALLLSAATAATAAALHLYLNLVLLLGNLQQPERALLGRQRRVHLRRAQLALGGLHFRRGLRHQLGDPLERGIHGVEIRLLRMVSQVPLDEGAMGNDPEIAGPDVREGATYELGAEARGLAVQVDVRVHEDDDPRFPAVSDQTNQAIADECLVAQLERVVPDDEALRHDRVSGTGSSSSQGIGSSPIAPPGDLDAVFERREAPVGESVAICRSSRIGARYVAAALRLRRRLPLLPCFFPYHEAIPVAV